MQSSLQVYFLQQIDAIVLEGALKDISRMSTEATEPEIMITQSTFSALGVTGLDSMAVARLGDYLWDACQESPCQDNLSEHSRSSHVSYVQPTSDLSTFQAIDNVTAVFEIHERMHLIPAAVVDKKKDVSSFLDSFGEAFWKFAAEHFVVDKDSVRNVVNAQREATTDDIFIAGTRAFHTVFDGIYGERNVVGDGDKRSRASLGGNVKVMLTFGGVIKKGQMMTVGTPPASRRYVPIHVFSHATTSHERAI